MKSWEGKFVPLSQILVKQMLNLADLYICISSQWVTPINFEGKRYEYENRNLDLLAPLVALYVVMCHYK